MRDRFEFVDKWMDGGGRELEAAIRNRQALTLQPRPGSWLDVAPSLDHHGDGCEVAARHGLMLTTASVAHLPNWAARSFDLVTAFGLPDVAYLEDLWRITRHGIIVTGDPLWAEAVADVWGGVTLQYIDCHPLKYAGRPVMWTLRRADFIQDSDPGDEA